MRFSGSIVSMLKLNQRDTSASGSAYNRTCNCVGQFAQYRTPSDVKTRLSSATCCSYSRPSPANLPIPVGEICDGDNWYLPTRKTARLKHMCRMAAATSRHLSWNNRREEEFARCSRVF